jgi:hypothetical protein
MLDASDPSGRRGYPRPGPATGPGGPARPPVPPTPPPVRSVRAPGFVLTAETGAGVDRISVAGDLTMATAAILDAEVGGLHGDGSRRTVRDLVLDLTDVTFLDVMGVAALRRIHEEPRPAGIRLGLPIAEDPRRLIGLAIERGWLPSAFRPTMPTF